MLKFFKKLNDALTFITSNEFQQLTTKFAERQAYYNQQYYHDFQRREKQHAVKVKFAYLSNKTSLTEAEQQEYDYCKHMINLFDVNSFTRQDVIDIASKVKDYCKDGYANDNLNRAYYQWDSFINDIMQKHHNK